MVWADIPSKTALGANCIAETGREGHEHIRRKDARKSKEEGCRQLRLDKRSLAVLHAYRMSGFGIGSDLCQKNRRRSWTR